MPGMHVGALFPEVPPGTAHPTPSGAVRFPADDIQSEPYPVQPNAAPALAERVRQRDRENHSRRPLGGMLDSEGDRVGRLLLQPEEPRSCASGPVSNRATSRRLFSAAGP